MNPLTNYEFITEHCQKLHGACHNVRTSGKVKYVTEDSVFYKREDKNDWHEPGVVTGQVNQ